MKIKEPMVSIIMGIYNCENTLRQSIESILNQSYKNWELIMCDDNSTDGTYDIALNYSKKYENIKLIENKKNEGLAYSLNKCIKIAKGELIARNDADDISKPDRIAKQVEFLLNNDNISFVGTAIELFDNSGIWGERFLKSKPTKIDLVKGSTFVHPTIIIKREALESVNYYTVSSYTRRGQDYDLWMKLYAKDYRGYNIPEKMYLFREGKEDFSKKKFSVRIKETRLRLNGYNAMKVPFKYYIYILKPIIIGLIPLKLQHLYRVKKDSLS